MAFVESRRQQYSVEFQDDINPQKRKLVSSLAPLHYDDGNEFQRIDTTPKRVNNAQFDGWRITNNGWHYAIGRPSGKSGDGWVGFGGRRGEHWFQFRLRHVGYYYDQGTNPDIASNWTHINPRQPQPDYTRANIQQNTVSKVIEGETFNYRESITWNNLWTAPGGGELYIRWRIDGDKLKEDVVINEAARNWIAANRPPSTPANETYLSFAFELDWSDIPRRVLGSVLKGADDEIDATNEGLELRNALDELLAFMPVDDVIVKERVDTGRLDLGNNPVIEEVQHRRRMKRRFYRDPDGRHYLIVGVKVSDLVTLPSGDLIFDPTLSPSIGASTDDARSDDAGYQDDLGTTRLGGVGPSPGVDYGGGFRFTGITLSGSDTVDSVYIEFVKVNSHWPWLDINLTFEDSDNAATFSSGSPPGARTCITTGVPFVNYNDNLTDGSSYQYPKSSDTTNRSALATILQAVIDRAGWSSGNAVALLDNPDTYASSSETYSRTDMATYDHPTYAAPILYIEYTAGGGPTYVDRAAVATVEVDVTAAGERDREGAAAPTIELTVAAAPERIIEGAAAASVEVNITAAGEKSGQLNASAQADIEINTVAASEKDIESAAVSTIDVDVAAVGELSGQINASAQADIEIDAIAASEKDIEAAAAPTIEIDVAASGALDTLGFVDAAASATITFTVASAPATLRERTATVNIEVTVVAGAESTDLCGCPADLLDIRSVRPFASVDDVTEALMHLSTRTLGKIDQDVDPLWDPDYATGVGFNGLWRAGAPDVLYLRKPDHTLYISGDGGYTWDMLAGPNKMVVGRILPGTNPNAGDSVFVIYPEPQVGGVAQIVYDTLGSLWASFDRGDTWIQLQQSPLYDIVDLTPVLCQDGVWTTMTGNLTISYDGFYYVSHRVEFSAGTLTASQPVQSQIWLNSAEAIDTVPARTHGQAGQAVAIGNSVILRLSEDDVLQQRVRIDGSGNQTPDAASLALHLIKQI